MALIVEDGSIVAGANTFITDAEFTAYADARGLAYPATEAEREPLIIRAVDYIVSIEDKLQGWRTDEAQVLPYPRANVWLRCNLLSPDSIPIELKNAQCEAALYEAEGSLLIQGAEQDIASEKVDVIAVSYHSGGSYQAVRTDRIDAYLKPLMMRGGKSGMTVRF